ncbi:MAG TPA: DUF4910 domain-containing protein [Elusimicrobiota bacterium]|nr:DUF4910 domain-containing protein [Elusimicrobiota bacterium]
MVDLKKLDRLLQLNIGISQAANREMMDIFNNVTPIRVRRYPAGREYNGWVVPHDWVVKKAHIRKKGKILFDGTVHPMAVAGYSSSFHGTVSKKELDKHLFTKKEFPAAYPFHSIYNYRPWGKHWGFCVPYNVCKKWPAGDYEIDLETEFKEGEMLAGECRHPGELKDTVVFNAHTCHPCQANDDMAGALVVLELFKWLATQKTRYSYLGVLAPEHVGTVFYLSDFSDKEVAELKLGCFVEMPGTKTPLVLQKSFEGNTIMDRVAKYVLGQEQPRLRVGEFRTVVGNDETVWEAPGIEVPMVSISRWPYRQYHTSDDNVKIMDPERLEQFLECLKRIVRVFEDDRTIERRFRGLVSLANPKYNLYIERPDPVVDKGLSPMDLRFGRMQDPLPRYFDGKHTVFEISEKFDVPFEKLSAYLREFERKGLIKLQPPPSLDHYKPAGA